MHVEKLSLKNFRNLDDLTLELDKGINIFSGENAQGKTNLLESIYFCATGRSHRTHLYKELIKFGEKETYIKLFANNDSFVDCISVHIKKESNKGIAVNNIPVKKLGELFGILLVVIFSPEDLQLIKAGPSERRKFMDMELCQLSPLYYYELGQYYNVLRQRNNLLKEIKKNIGLKDTMFVWDQQLITHGIKIMKHRQNFIEKINIISNKIHSNITNNKECLNIIYRPNTTDSDFLIKLNKNIDRDIMQGSTSVGIHKDDLGIFINDIDVRTYGSQGQQRTASLSTKFAEIELIYQEKKTYPVVLLDDVLSELDETRQKFLLEQIENLQTIITCTGIEDIIKKISHLVNINIYNVKNGSIVKQNVNIN